MECPAVKAWNLAATRTLGGCRNGGTLKQTALDAWGVRGLWGWVEGYGVIVAHLIIVIGGNCIVVKIAIGMCIVLREKDGSRR